MKMKRCVINDDLYHGSFLVQRGGTLQQCISRYADLIGVDSWTEVISPKRVGHFGSYEGFSNGFIWLHPKAGVNSLTHECMHAVHYFLGECRGTKLSNETEEVYAYYIGWLAGEITKRLF